MPGNSWRNSTAAANSQSCSKAARIAAASSSVTTNIPTAWRDASRLTSRVRAAAFAQVRALYDDGLTAAAITRKLGLSRKRVDKRIRLEALPERNAKTPTPVSPAYYDGYLARRWAEGCAVARRLLTEIHRLGFTGCYTHLARFIASWRCAAEPEEKRQMANPVVVLPHDPIAGRLLTPQIACALREAESAADAASGDCG